MKWKINLVVEADRAASKADIIDFLECLTWAGGSRRPEDPMFDSLEVIKQTISQYREKPDAKTR